MTPLKSETVLVNDPAVPSNGSTEHAALITAVHGAGPNPLINAKVFPDGGAMYNTFSVYHRDDRPEDYEGPTWYRTGDLELPKEHQPANDGDDDSPDEPEDAA